MSDLGMDVGIDSLWHEPKFPDLDEETQFYLKIKNHGLQQSLIQVYKDQIFQTSFELLEQNDTTIIISENGFDIGTNTISFLLHSPGDKNQSNNSQMVRSLYHTLKNLF